MFFMHEITGKLAPLVLHILNQYSLKGIESFK